MPRREGRAGRRQRAAAEPEARREDERPAGRGIWSGSITFGLVTIPVELYTAQRQRAPSLRMLGTDGAPLSRQYVCPAENAVLEPDEIVRGYEVAENEFVLLSDEELEALAPRRSRDIELTRFVDRDAIDPGYFVRAYFLVPGGEQTKAYRLLAETMESSGRAALASFVMRDKAYAVAIFADKGILRAETLRFGDELRSAETVGLPEPVEADPGRVDRMRKAIESLAAAELDEAELRDDGAERLSALAREKRERGEDVVEVPDAAAEPTAGEADGDGEGAAGGEVVDLMALLKARLRAPEGAVRPKRVSAKAAAGASARRTERVRAPAKRKSGAKLSDPSKEALLERARELDIPGRSRMSRAELARAIHRLR